MVDKKTFQINITGIVQGVGFRPFIFKLASQNNLQGDVCNTSAGVIIRINAADRGEADNFIKKIIDLKPAPAAIETIEVSEIDNQYYSDFKILKSQPSQEKFQLVSPDLATCNKCSKDINNPKDKRRFNYAFTNCTNCGPRFTIIKKLPYDRQNTTMSDFTMCPECLEEYNDPLNRRFHAQPNACNKCGPELLFTDSDGRLIDDKNPIKRAVNEIIKGKIIGIKSLGGFQLACDASSGKAVLKLRKKKNRPFKPFAIMVKDIRQAQNYYKLSRMERELLSSPKAPVVLLKKKTVKFIPNKKDSILLKQNNKNTRLKNSGTLKTISEYVSFNNKYEGVMLPYTPLHHLLFKEIDFPLIMTSGNISEEPIAFKNDAAIKSLGSICDFFLMHNRDIFSRFDDSVVKVFKNKEMIIRRARGYAPYPVKIKPGLKSETVLAIGSEEKNTFCIIKKNYAIVSQHIGDIDNENSISFFKSTLKTYYSLFNIDKTDLIASDMHPAFRLNSFASDKILADKKIKVQHHKAHIASVIAENNINEKVIGFAWDGTGFGDDGKIWGSEIFIVDKKLNFKRIGHLSEKILPGGEITIHKPYRMAITYIYYSWIKMSENTRFLKNKPENNNLLSYSNNYADYFIKYIRANFPGFNDIVSDKEIMAIVFQIKSRYNSIETTSMGRLFDAVSSILNLKSTSSFEGEAAIELEMFVKNKVKECYKIKYINSSKEQFKKLDELAVSFLKGSGELNDLDYPVFIIDDISIMNEIIKDLLNKTDLGIISARFHNTLAKIILDISKKVRNQLSINKIALSGGVFQNNYLFEKVYDILENNFFEVYSNFKVPVNDGGVSLGQAYIGIKILSGLREDE